MNRNLLMLLFFVLALGACATLGTKLTGDNNRIDTPYYAVTLPPDQGWYLGPESGPGELRVVKKSPFGGVLFQMSFRRNEILDEKLTALSAEKVAADFFKYEERTMQEHGVAQGIYKLSNVSTEEEIHGNKRFFAMRYRTDAEKTFQSGWLYLYFPEAEGNRDFFMAHYTVTAPQTVFLANTGYSDFAWSLATLEMK